MKWIQQNVISVNCVLCYNKLIKQTRNNFQEGVGTL